MRLGVPMELYPGRALERAMKVQEVILRAIGGQINWMQAAEIIGLSDRTMRRWRVRYEEHGYDGLFDRRLKRPSPRRVPLKVVEEVLRLYRERYFDFNVRHFHEKLRSQHGIQLSYTWVKLALQTAGLVKRRIKRGRHHRRRERRPLSGMMLHIDGSKHAWVGPEQGQQDLITLMDDATSRVYYAQLVEEESTASVMAALREVVQKKGVFCSLYSDRASHFVFTPTAGGRPDPSVKTQVGRALEQLGIELIPANSPQARGRCERALRHIPGAVAAGTEAAWHQLDGSGQPVLARDLRGRAQPTVRGIGSSKRHGFRPLPRRRVGENLLLPGATHRRQRQHRRPRQAAPPDPASEVPLQPGPLPSARLPPSGSDSQRLLRPPSARPVRRFRRPAGQGRPTNEKNCVRRGPSLWKRWKSAHADFHFPTALRLLGLKKTGQITCYENRSS